MSQKYYVTINGVEFQKSRFSSKGGKHCVGVSPIPGGGVMVTNTNHADVVIHFSKDEWKAFLAGVKSGEFD